MAHQNLTFREKLFILLQKYSGLDVNRPSAFMGIHEDELNIYMEDILINTLSPLDRKKLRRAFFEQEDKNAPRKLHVRGDWEPITRPYEIFFTLLLMPESDIDALALREIYYELDDKKVWLDDLRPAPNGWHHVKTAKEAIHLLSIQNVTKISLDNDLGLDDQEGYDVLLYLEEAGFTDPSFKMPEILIHTANPVAREKMEAGIKNIKGLSK